MAVDIDDEPKTSRECLKDPATYSIANWRLRNSGLDNQTREQELANSKKLGPGVLRAAKKVFDDLEKPVSEN